jgi:hypothetical protein
MLVLGGLIWWITSSNRSPQANLPQTPPAVADAARGIKDTANKTVDTADATLAALVRAGYVARVDGGGGFVLHR